MYFVGLWHERTLIYYNFFLTAGVNTRNDRLVWLKIILIPDGQRRNTPLKCVCRIKDNNTFKIIGIEKKCII